MSDLWIIGQISSQVLGISVHLSSSWGKYRELHGETGSPRCCEQTCHKFSLRDVVREVARDEITPVDFYTLGNASFCMVLTRLNTQHNLYASVYVHSGCVGVCSHAALQLYTCVAHWITKVCGTVQWLFFKSTRKWLQEVYMSFIARFCLLLCPEGQNEPLRQTKSILEHSSTPGWTESFLFVLLGSLHIPTLEEQFSTYNNI